MTEALVNLLSLNDQQLLEIVNGRDLPIDRKELAAMLLELREDGYVPDEEIDADALIFMWTV